MSSTGDHAPINELAHVRHGRHCLGARTAGGGVLSGAHGVCELAEPTKLRGATTKVAAEAVRRSGRHPQAGDRAPTWRPAQLKSADSSATKSFFASSERVY